MDRRFSKAISRIYDAALDPARWTEALLDIAALTGRGQAALGYLDYNARTGQKQCIVGYDSDYDMAEVVRHDPWARRLPAHFSGELAIGSAVLPENERAKDFFCNELAPSLGMVSRDSLATFITHAGERGGGLRAFGGLVVYSDERQGSFGSQDLEIMRRVRPHLVKALEVQSRLEAARAAELVHQDLLDQMGSGLWLLDARGRILFANAKALELQKNPSFSVHAQTLGFADPEHDTRFQRAIKAAQGLSATVLDGESGAFFVPSPSLACPLSVLVMPTDFDSPAMHIIGTPSPPKILVSISDRNPRLDMKLQQVQSLYGLTGAERRVLPEFMDGRSLSEIAASLGVSVYTIRTQIKSIMEKTGTHSQRELMLLVFTIAF